MTSLMQYMTAVTKYQLMNYIEEKYTYTKEEKEEYYQSDDYDIHLNYLIENWVCNIKNEFNSDIHYNENFHYINNLFQDGIYCPDFNNEWLDDIFVHHILDNNVCLK